MIPGLGQYQIYKKTLLPNHRIRALVFFGIELLSAGIHYRYRADHNNQKDLYKTFANNNWDFSHWLSSYNDFNGTAYESIWTDPQGVYTQIGESSHFVQFYFNGELKRTTDDDFLDLYETLLSEIDAGIDIYNQYSITESLHIPLSSIESGESINEIKILSTKKNLYVFCKSGQRSLRAIKHLNKFGIRGINIEGGIEAWNNKKIN